MVLLCFEHFLMSTAVVWFGAQSTCGSFWFLWQPIRRESKPSFAKRGCWVKSVVFLCGQRCTTAMVLPSAQEIFRFMGIHSNLQQQMMEITLQHCCSRQQVVQWQTSDCSIIREVDGYHPQCTMPIPPVSGYHSHHTHSIQCLPFDIGR